MALVVTLDFYSTQVPFLIHSQSNLVRKILHQLLMKNEMLRAFALFCSKLSETTTTKRLFLLTKNGNEKYINYISKLSSKNKLNTLRILILRFLIYRISCSMSLTTLQGIVHSFPKLTLPFPTCPRPCLLDLSATFDIVTWRALDLPASLASVIPWNFFYLSECLSMSSWTLLSVP